MNAPLTVQAYKNFIIDFKASGDAADFRIAALRLGVLEPELAASTQAMVQSLDSTGKIPAIDTSDTN